MIAAVRPEFRQGFTEVIATRGGKRGERVDQRRFLMPVVEYDSGPFGFVIDEVRHPIGPSSFVAIGDDLRGSGRSFPPFSPSGPCRHPILADDAPAQVVFDSELQEPVYETASATC